MKKVTAREFQKRFGKVAKQLPEGQTIQVTNHGKPLGFFTKAAPRKTKMPDFLSNLQYPGADPRLGEQILKEFHASLS